MSSAKSFHETFYGTPTEDESRRRRGKKRHNKAVKEEPQNEVAVVGVHYRSFDDDSMAAFVNSATALVPWNGDSKLLIDRYDVRHLLQDLTGIRRRRARPPSPDATKEELDYERYRDVEGLENPSPHEDELKNGDDTGAGYQRVGFDYGTGGDHATRKERVEDALFSPPFSVPEHLRAKIPTSTKVHQIMAGTAKYVIEHGGQAEIVLRVKQANNPTFGFLMPDHYDHEYFRFLVAHPEHVGIAPTLQPQEAAVPEAAAPASSSEVAEGGLSLLGTAYGDADEDDEEEGKEGEVVVKNPAEEPQSAAAAADALENVEDGKKEQIDFNSEHGATSKRSSTPNLTASDGTENATKDTGDSLEVPHGSEHPKSAGQQSSEVPADGMIDSSSGSQEPAPPGMEASCSGAAEAEGHGQAGDLDDQVVPPHKEPPNRLRLIINKMVEFIARNGKEFEAIVKERDKTDHRFPFFLPWNEYHPYFAKELESARQAHLSPENGVAGIPSASEPSNPVQSQEAEAKGEGTFLNGVPFWDISQAAEVNVGANDGEEGMADNPESEEDKSHNGEGGMDFDAVLAAVRFATRGRPQSAEGHPESHSRKASDGNEAPDIGSDEAVLAAIRAATGRTKLDSSGSVTEKEISHLAGSSGPAATDTRDPAQSSTAARGAAAVGDMKDPPQTSTLSRNASVGGMKDPFQTSTLSRLASVADSSNPIGTATALSPSNAEAPVGLDEDHEAVSRVVTKAASAASPDEERNSAEPRLTTPEKRKAERLKKAKLFAAMIKDKNGLLTNPAAHGTSAPNLDRLNHVFVALESTTLKSGGEVPAAPIDIEPETRDPTGDTQVHVASEADKEVGDTSVKQRKHKVKSKDHEERKRKHHHKRKKDTEERENESKHSPSTGERRKDKHHDHYQDAKRKEKKHGRELEGKAKDSGRQKEGKFRSEEGFKDHDDWTDEEYDETRKNRSRYTHDTDGRRKVSRYGYEADQKKRRHRHGEDSEGARKESRHGYESEEERRLARQKHDADRMRKDRRHRHDSEERRSADRYEHDSDGRRKERSRRHGKRKKDISDESDDKDSRRNEHRTKKSKLQGDDSARDTESAHVERQSLHHRDPEDGVKVGVVSPVKHDAMLQTRTTQARVGEEKSSTLSSADVPDDIRAKVRAMLAMM